MTDDLPSQVQNLLTPQVFEFVSEARARFETDDLVVFLDLTEAAPELQALPRARVKNMDAGQLRDKLGKPASEVLRTLHSPLHSFWFVAVLHDDDGGMACCAVNASMMAPSSTALN